MSNNKLGRYERFVMKELYEALDSLLQKTIANRGSEHAFISNGGNAGLPWQWVRGEQALERAARFYGEDLGVGKRTVKTIVLTSNAGQKDQGV